MKIGIIGIGFVGLSHAAALGSMSFNVLAIDSDKEKIKKLVKALLHFMKKEFRI